MNDLPEVFLGRPARLYEADKVIPIIGPELVTVPAADGEIPLYRHVAERLAERLRVPVADLPPGYSLNQVVCRILGQPIWSARKISTHASGSC